MAPRGASSIMTSHRSSSKLGCEAMLSCRLEAPLVSCCLCCCSGQSMICKSLKF